jgi:DNA-binding CsgD family transcriptional regulator
VAAAIEAAAEAARERGAPSTAAELAEQAVRLTDTDRASDRLRRLLLAAEMHQRAGDPGRASDLLTQALADATAGTDRATVLLHLADAAPSPTSIALYEEALAEAALAASPDHALRATIHLRLADSMGWGTGWPGRVRHARLAIQAASRVDDVVLRAVTIARDCLSRFYAGQGLDETGMDEAVALERTLPQWPLPEGPTLMYGTQLFWAAEVARAREVLRTIEHAIPSGQEPLVEADLKWFLGFVEWRAGDWDLAERYLTESLDIRAQFGEPAPPAEFPVAIIEAHRGQVDAVRARSSRAIGRGQSMGIRIAESGHGWVLGFLELSLGQPERALIHLRRCYEIRNDFMLEPAQRLELGDLMEALIAVGALDEAGGIIDVWQPRARAVDRAWALAILHRGRAQLLAASGGLDAAFEEFERALTEHDRSPDPFHRARTLLALGRTQRRARRRATARSTLDEALAGFGRLGATLWAEQTRVELARIGGRGAASAELTEAERRIADLVAEGRSNREVADALFLTVHTVETALTRIYRKLGVSSRAGLARLHAANT